jgi:mono/diheme cytochrome c family protein
MRCHLESAAPAARFAVFVFLVFAIAMPPIMISQNSTPQAVANGRRIFNQSCAACHDTFGTTTKSGPGLKNYYRHQPRPAEATVRTIIQQGKGKMPAFSTLNKSQTDDLVAYLKTL